MRWRFFLLLLFILFSAFRIEARTIRVVTDNNYPPYVFIGTDGQPQGYVVDLWKLWEKKSGVHVDFQPMQWSEAQRSILDGDADVIDMIFRTSVRDQLYDFSPPYVTLDVGVYVSYAIKGIYDVASMQGFTVGVQAGDACADELAREGITELSAFPNYESMLAAARSGDIKMFCMDDEPANYYLYLYRDQISFTKAFTLYQGQFHWAVQKDHVEMFNLVDQGMKLITAEERSELDNKWLKHPIEFRSYLKLIAFVVIGCLVILISASLWIWFLRRLVNKRTNEIQQKNSELELAHQALLLEKTQLRTIVETSPDALALKNKDGIYIDCNSEMERLLGVQKHKIIGYRADELITDESYLAAVKLHDQTVFQSGSTVRYTQKHVGLDGCTFIYEVVKIPIKTSTNEVVSLLTVLRDITERQRVEQELRIASVAFESHDGMMITDEKGYIQRVNEAFYEVTGYGSSEVMGQKLTLLRSGVHEPDFYLNMWTTLERTGYWTGEVVNIHRDGHLYTARLSISAVLDDQGVTIHYVGNLQDISAEKQAQELAEHLKQFDQLTDLPNRTFLEEHLRHLMLTNVFQREYGAVILLDLDFFQKINDSLGHAIGDRMLKEVSYRIRSKINDTQMLSRFSGDTFVVLCEHLSREQHQAMNRAFEIAETIRGTLAEPFLLDEHSIVCSGSVGVTLFTESQAEPDILLRQAELAMYESKRCGKNTVRFFEEAMQAELDKQNQLENELRTAIQKNQFELYYQIQVSQDKTPIGAEALLRWKHPERGMVPPFEFIPLAEETGLIEAIGQWVIATACQQLAIWAKQEHLSRLTLAVNISPRQFKSPHFVEDILKELQQSGVSPHKLKLEITESLAIDNFESSIVKLETLRKHGLLISLDDFGTGNSSLNYLTKLPLTQLKIDKSFVDELPDNHRDAMVAQTIIAMGHGLEMDVIAEGVETQTQYEFLVEQGCHAFQGYLFGKPRPLIEFETSVRESIRMRLNNELIK